MTKLRTVTDLQAQLTAANQIAILDGDRIRYVSRAAWERAQGCSESAWAEVLALVQNVGEMYAANIARLKAAGLYVEEVKE